MHCNPLLHGPAFLRDTTAHEVMALLSQARAHVRGAAGLGRPLLGRHAAVLGEACGSASADLFEHAARALGATVARLPLASVQQVEPAQVPTAARLLGRLYCAIGCDPIGAPLAGRLSGWSGLPVFDGVAVATHPTRLLADLLTLTEESGRPPDRLALWVEGDAGSVLAQAWRRIGELTGLSVVVGRPAGDPPASRTGFVCRRDDDAASTPATLLALDGAGAPARSLEALQLRHHGGLLELLLAQRAS